MSIKPTVKAEITQLGWNAVLIWPVVAAHGYRHSPGTCRKLSYRLGDVERKLVIAAPVRPYQVRPHPQRGRLPSALKIQNRPAAFKRVLDGDSNPIPPLSPVVSLVRITLIQRVEAMRQPDRLPLSCFFPAPHVFCVFQNPSVKLPPGIESPGGRRRLAARTTLSSRSPQLSSKEQTASANSGTCHELPTRE